ncbi:YjzC family protein [Enhygromyxa salina]|uniref:YjzC family protein n=1 Tax=Enhygromyxa salina TaxID=215803 RepID=UPI0011BABF96
MTNIGDQFKTGATCPTSGSYVFDRYADAPSTTPQPTQDERVIPMTRGNPFPPVRSTNAAAWWKLQRIS